MSHILYTDIMYVFRTFYNSNYQPVGCNPPPYIISPGILRGDLTLREGTCTDCLVMPKFCLLLKSYPHFRTLKKNF